MITRDALYSKIETLITTANPSDAIRDAVSFRNLTGAVDSAQKVIRVQCFDGIHGVSDEPKEKEKNVRATIQLYVLPESTEETDLDDAIDESFDMSREIFDALVADPGLTGLVCICTFNMFETGYANLGATRYGATWLDGIINHAS